MKTKIKKPNVTEWFVSVKGAKRPMLIAATSQAEAESLAKRDGYQVLKPTPPSPGSSTPSSSKTPATSKPSPTTASTPACPVVKTETPNGTKPGARHYAYQFHAESDMDIDSSNLAYLPACAKDLASRKFPNIGDAFLGVYGKFMGVRQVRQVDLRWACNTFRLDVVITITDGDPVKIGWLEPTDEWYTVDAEGKETSRHVPTTYTPPPKPPDPGLLEATRPLPGETPDKPAKAPKGKEGPQTADPVPARKPGVRIVAGVELSKSKKFPDRTLIYGWPVNAIVRWCGWDAWDKTQVFRLLAGLGLAADIQVATVERQIQEGRSGKSPLKVPTLNQFQEDSLVAVAEKYAPKKKK